MFNWIKKKITYMQYQCIISAITAIVIALSQFDIDFIGVDQIELISGSVWGLLVALGFAIQKADEKKEEEAKVFKSK